MGKSSSVKRYVIDDNQIKEICKAAADAGVEAYVREKEREETDKKKRVLNSSKVLLKNYRRFKAMCTNAVYDDDTVSNELNNLTRLMTGKFWQRNVEITSIKDKVARTRLIMDHVDTMLKVFERQCYDSDNEEDSRMFRVISGLYLSPDRKSINEVCEEENITVRTVYRDCDKAYKVFAILCFGIDGLQFR